MILKSHNVNYFINNPNTNHNNYVQNNHSGILKILINIFPKLFECMGLNKTDSNGKNLVTVFFKNLKGL